ncbi:putative Protein VAC14-like protein, partial [Naja naja]
QLCLLLNAENIFHSMADILLREEDLRFASTMVHTLNTILLTSSELFQLRNQLKDLKSPVDLRLQLLDVKSNPYLLKALYGLLMLLPQSNAFQLLSHRLQDPAKAGQAARKTVVGPAIDYVELLQHFERVQGKHLQGRHQRAVRAGEAPERRGAATF